MFLGFLKLIHAFFGLNAVATAIPVSIRMVSGRPFERWAVRFLKYSLGDGALGIMIPPYHGSSTRWAAMLGVYMSGGAVLAWRKLRSAEIWARVFVLGTMGVLCLNTVIAVAHVFRVLAMFNLTPSSYLDLLFLGASSMVVLLFAGLIKIALRRFHTNTNRSVATR